MHSPECVATIRVLSASKGPCIRCFTSQSAMWASTADNTSSNMYTSQSCTQTRTMKRILHKELTGKSLCGKLPGSTLAYSCAVRQSTYCKYLDVAADYELSYDFFVIGASSCSPGIPLELRPSVRAGHLTALCHAPQRASSLRKAWPSPLMTGHRPPALLCIDQNPCLGLEAHWICDANEDRGW